MRSSLRAICLLILPLLPHLSAAEEWKVAEPGWKYVFPRDHGPHRDFKTEWWYSTGCLRDEEGREYGFQLTFFRQGIHPGASPPGSSRFRVAEIPFAHFALTDVSGKTFRYFQKTSRGAFGEAGFSLPSAKEPRMAWMENWFLEAGPDGIFHLKAEDEGRGVDLTLAEFREPLIHGTDGISPKSAKPGHASHYYSLTRLKASGTVSINGKSRPVSGLVWFDHEWATNQLDPGEAGWDWSGLHLSNGGDLMLFRIRDGEGRTVFLSGTLRDADGVIRTLSDPEMSPRGTWRSPHTGGVYPASWDLKIPSLSLTLTITPRLADQELVLPPFAYWEGSVKGEGMLRNEVVTAEGYFEMTGYGGKILGLSK